jgi:Na+/H+-dicarboxylate symporter
MELGHMAPIVWFGCFAVVTIDSGWRKISPVFWFLASLFGGPFALLAYGLIREKAGK